ncbi:MAG: hypothetical protein IJE74_05830 [Clostridia bacterium]|nr:hypothetical protein [Clostridia bacterium]
MNEITNALKIVNTAFRTVGIIDYVKRAVIAFAALFCCFSAVKLFRKQKEDRR